MIKPGTVSNQMVSNYDFLNTLAEIVEGKTIINKDGVSYAKTLFGGKSKERDFTVYSSVMGPALVTKKGWKLRYFLKKDRFQLYFLPNGYKEENDLSSKYLKKTDSLKQILFKACGNNWKNGFGRIKLKFKNQNVIFYITQFN
jgi:arylsulfatase A-like enzyme